MTAASTTVSQANDFLARSNGTTYAIRAAPPVGNDRTALFVVLDGDDYFNFAVDTATQLNARGSIPPTTVVGISAKPSDGNALNARLRDYTDEVPEASKPERVRLEGVKTGGVGHFAAFLHEELLPGLFKRYGIDPRCTTVFGHSLGGLAVLHMLALGSPAFSKYAASSPSVWWGNRSILNRLRSLPPAPSDKRPQLLVTVGSLEQSVSQTSAQATAPSRTQDFQMIENARKVVMLAAAQPRAVTVNFSLIEGRTHETVAPESIRRALMLSAECQSFAGGKRQRGDAANLHGGGK